MDKIKLAILFGQMALLILSEIQYLASTLNNKTKNVFLNKLTKIDVLISEMSMALNGILTDKEKV